MPAGVVVSGGGSGITTVEDIARAVLKLPSRRASLILPEAAKVKDATWAVAYGLCLWGINSEVKIDRAGFVRERVRDVLIWAKQFLP